MSFIFAFLLLLCQWVKSDLNIPSENTAKVNSLDNPQNHESCNSDLSLTNEKSNPGGKSDFESEALGGGTDAAAKKFASRRAGGRAVAGTKDDLPCSTPLAGYQQDDPVLVRFYIGSPLSCLAV